MTIRVKKMMPDLQRLASRIGIATDPHVFVQLGDRGPRIAVSELKASGRDIVIITDEPGSEDEED